MIFALTTKEKIVNYAKQLNGHIILIRGNHERSSIKFYEEECGFEVIRSKYWTLVITNNNKLNKYAFSHKPMEDIFPEDMINLHGHIHNCPLDSKFKSNTHKCVSVEMTDYKPIKLL